MKGALRKQQSKLFHWIIDEGKKTFIKSMLHTLNKEMFLVALKQWFKSFLSSVL